MLIKSNLTTQVLINNNIPANIQDNKSNENEIIVNGRKNHDTVETIEIL